MFKGPDMMTISAEFVRKCLDYDPGTGIFRWKINSANQVKSGMVAGYVGSYGYINIRIKGRSYKAHRLAWLWVHGRFPANEIDHINHDRADNRIANLRLATRLDNTRNNSRHRHNTSGVNGVHFNKKSGKWVAYISVRKKKRHLGRFCTLDEAAAARAEADVRFGFHENHGTA